MRYNTGNPVEPNGSDDPRDAYDNFANMDLGVNSKNPSWIDREGEFRKTWWGMEQQVSNYLFASGYESVYVTYGAGMIVQRQTQLVQRNGELYRVINSADLPLTLTGTWATDAPKLQAVGDQALRQQLGEGFRQKLDASWYQPNDLDMSGGTDESAKVTAYLNLYKRVRLPAGTIKMNIVVPSWCALTGAGRTLLNRTSKVWLPGGTTVFGSIFFTGSQGCTLSRMNVDGYVNGNAVGGVSSTTRFIRLDEVNTRASDHNQLWEQNGTTTTGDAGGDIHVENCYAYDGPNGFVTKMLRATFVNCLAFDTTVQAFVAVSDNINGPTTYSRAQQSRFINCGGDGNHQGLTVYSRDAFSTNNANNVNGTKGTYWGGNGKFTNIGNCNIHVGHYRPVSGFTPLFNEEVVIDGGDFSGSPLFGIRFDDAARPRVLSGHFANCPNHIVFGVNCVDPYVSDEVSYFGAVNGILRPQAIESSGASAINVDDIRKILIFRNTVSTQVNVLVSSAAQRVLKVLIDDAFTTLTIDSKVYTGRGVCLDLSYNGSAWTVVGASSKVSPGEVTLPFATTISFTWPSAAVYIAASGNIASISPSGSNLPIGQRLAVRIRNISAVAVTIGSWPGLIWGGVAPVTSLAASQTVVVEIYFDGTNHLVVAGNRF
ncbi:hypothetical protein DM813_19255 [Pseudomonas alkylphenolica]|uniref:Uncharacterized protein n=1 Tax=Pseudomonas alkylphenolica TaxID=237609 RepID=A0A443ZQF3_9PSED|nr:hypothetical protein [Pseudomonas alkylphenolica]RWU21325.1 hypothetical protein DM813_19255 [Pseudomonas alkylphenolica]